MRDVTSIVYFPNFISRTKIKSAMNNITDVTILIAVIALVLCHSPVSHAIQCTNAANGWITSNG